jgi:hypothetical protein
LEYITVGVSTAEIISHKISGKMNMSGHAAFWKEVVNVKN